MKRAATIAIRTGSRLAKAGCEVIHWKSTLTGAVRDPAAAAKRAVRRGRYRLEDRADELVLAVRKQPLKWLGMTFGIGMGFGILMGLQVKQR